MTVTEPSSLSTSTRIQAWIDQRPNGRPLRCWVLGYGPLGQAVAEGVSQCDPQLITLAGVFPWSSKPSEKRFASEPSEFIFRQWLKRQGIPILGFPSANHYRFTQQLLSDQIDVVFVATWGEILNPSLLNQTQTLFINIHPSLLPDHRGPNPYSAVLLHQEKETGFSAHVMDAHIDTGPLIAKYPLTIHDNDTGLTLRQRISGLTQTHMVDLIQEIRHCQHAWPEQTEKGSYDRALQPNDCYLNWTEEPLALDHRLRAIYPWEQPWRELPPWRLVFDSGRIIPHRNIRAAKPGEIIQRERHHLLVASSNAERAIMLVNPSLNGLWRVLNPMVLPFMLRPGRQL